MLYLAVLLTVLGKAALVSECVPTFITSVMEADVAFTLASGPNTPLQVSSEVL